MTKQLFFAGACHHAALVVGLLCPTLLRRATLLGALLAAHVSAAWAQTQLDEAVITANRLPQKQAQTVKVLNILPDSVLRRYEAQSLSTLLNTQTGIWIQGANSAPGTFANIYFRGANVGYTAVLLNGIPVNDPSAPIGNFDLNTLALSQIGRIEILKGSQSILYGSDAVAGVINLIPRSEQVEDARLLSGSLSGGSYGNIQAAVGINGKSKGLNYGVHYNVQRIAGFSAAYDSLNTDDFDNDGLQRHVAQAHLSQQIGKRFTLRAMGQWAHSRADLDAGAFKDDKDYTSRHKHFTVGAGFDAQWGRITWKGNYAFYNTDRSYIDDSTYVPPMAFSHYSKGDYRARNHFAELYGSRSWGQHIQLLAGLEWRQANTDQSYFSVSSFGPYEEPPIGSDSARIAQYSGYVSLLLNDLAGFNLELGTRLNRHDLYGNNLSYQAGISRFIGQSVKLFGSVSSGFRAPSLYQLFSPYGNRQLKPETALHFEGGLQWYSSNRQLSLRALAFGRNTDQIITTESLANFPYLRYINQNEQRDWGIETDLTWQHKRWNASLGYAFVDGKVTAIDAFTGNDTTYNNLFRRPKHRVTLQVGYQILPALYAELRLQTASSRTDLFFDETTFSTVQRQLDGIALIDLYVSYNFKPNVQLFADLRNLSNARYFELTGYSARRFNFDAGLRVTIH
ncbi:MAG: TonB-dependent receptor [Sphingobacteriales bacterium]|nr:TonB-dependent receptor [Sphingobacteriales bacterium]